MPTPHGGGFFTVFIVIPIYAHGRKCVDALCSLSQGDTEHIRAAIDEKERELEPHSDRLNKQKAKADTQRTEVTLLSDRLSEGEREAETLQKLHAEVTLCEALAGGHAPSTHLSVCVPLRFPTHIEK